MKTNDHYLKQEFDQLLKEGPHFLDFLEAGSLDGTWYWDLEQPENEWMSERFWKLFGYERHEKKHLASEWQDMIHPEDLKRATENFQKHLKDPEQPYDQVVRYRHRDGHTIWVRCRGIAIRDKSGRPVRMLGSHIDITAQMEAEAALRRKTIELEKTNRQLQEALDKIQTLKGLVPICTHCKSIRDDQGFWQDVEEYVEAHSTAEFSHSLCPDCLEEHYPELSRDVKDRILEKEREDAEAGEKTKMGKRLIKAPDWAG